MAKSKKEVEVTLDETPEVEVELDETPEVEVELDETLDSYWWDTVGVELERRGYSQRNIILRAASAAKQSFERAMAAMVASGTLEEKVKSLFK
jgi:hypothetical protein